MEVCNLHQTVHGKSNKKKRNGNNNPNLKNNDTNDDDDDDNIKKENNADDEGNLVTAHIAGFDKMDGFQKLIALVDDRHGDYNNDDDDSLYDIVYLH